VAPNGEEEFRMKAPSPLTAALLGTLLIGHASLLPAVPKAPPGDGCVEIGDCDDDDPPPVGECGSNQDCDDGDLCNGEERCVGPEGRGRCVPGVPRTCQDFDPCTSDACIDNECVNDPIPDCTAPTTTSSSTTIPTTASTSSTSTTTVRATSTTGHEPSTPTTTSPTATSTTLPGACSPGDAAACNDGDPCTVDACSPTATCTHEPFTGVASVVCTCERALPNVCTQPLPRRITRLIDRACRHSNAAMTLPPPRQGSKIRKAGRIFARAASLAIASGRRHALAPDCAATLATALRDARSRAQAAQQLP